MPTQLITILASGIFAAAVCSCTLAVMLRPKPLTTAERLVRVGAPEPPDPDEEPDAVQTLEQIELSRPFVARVIAPALQWIAGVVGRWLPGANPEAVSVKLAKAGAPPGLTVELYLSLKPLAVIAFAAVALLMQLVLLPPSTPTMITIWTVVSGIAGFFLPAVPPCSK